jgi:hypothetical protein
VALAVQVIFMLAVLAQLELFQLRQVVEQVVALDIQAQVLMLQDSTAVTAVRVVAVVVLQSLVAQVAQAVTA